MPENTLLSGSIDQIDLEFVEREATPRFLMKLSIQLHLAGLSLSNTVSMNELLHTKLEPTTNKVIAHAFVAELREKHDVDDAVFLIDGSQSLKAACSKHGRLFGPHEFIISTRATTVWTGSDCRRPEYH